MCLTVAGHFRSYALGYQSLGLDCSSLVPKCHWGISVGFELPRQFKLDLLGDTSDVGKVMITQLIIKYYWNILIINVIPYFTVSLAVLWHVPDICDCSVTGLTIDSANLMANLTDEVINQTRMWSYQSQFYSSEIIKVGSSCTSKINYKCINNVKNVAVVSFHEKLC